MTRKSIRERNAESIARAATPEPEQPTSSPAAPAAAPVSAEPAPAKRQAKATSTTKPATPPAAEPSQPVDVTGWTPAEHEELDEREAVADEQKAAQHKRQPQARNALEERRVDEHGRVTLGIYLTADMYAAMKSAYLADWGNGGQSDTLYKWVTAALGDHASRTPSERAGYASTGPARAEHRTGNTRAFKVDGDVYQRMQDALAADEAAQRWTSESAWSVEALTAAIEAARAANGGTLPDPPARLPNRLKRRGR